MRKLKLAIVGAVLAGGLLSGPAIAKDKPYAEVINYYTDASRTSLAGRTTTYCDGTFEIYGTSTPYQQVYQGFCP